MTESPALPIEAASALSEALPRSWYPICLSSELRVGEVRPFCFQEREWIVFRGSDGNPAVVGRYCSHMGVDLANGAVIASRLRCPLHGWEYNDRGRCVNIPATPEIPGNARVASLPARDVFGVVYFFTNPEPLFDIPLAASPDLPRSRAHRVELPVPYLAVSLNAFDMQHFKHVHNREVVGETVIQRRGRYGLSVEFTARVMRVRMQDRIMHLLGFRSVDIKIDCHGGNILVMENTTADVRALFSLAPTSDGMVLYVVTIARQRVTGLFAKAWQRFHLEAARRLITAFLRPDGKVLQNMHVRSGVLLPGIDASVETFWKYWNSLPRQGE